MDKLSWHQYIEKIRETANFVSYIEKLTDLPRMPSNGQAVMAKSNPFRSENTPSLAVYEDHACDYGDGNRIYDVFDVVQFQHNCDFSEAVGRLAHDIGIQRPDKRMTKAEREQADKQRTAYHLLRLARDYYSLRLDSEDGQKVREYAYSRGFDDDIIRNELIGASGGLRAHFQAAGINLDDAVQAGLLYKKDGRYYDAIPSGYLVFSYLYGGKVRFLSGRMADPNAPKDKKARNIRDEGLTPKIPYFNKVYTSRSERVVVVEGATDAITLAMWGIPAVALAGTHTSEQLVERLKRHNVVYLCLDDDEAGQKATEKAARLLGPLTQVITLDAHDVNQYAQDGGDVDDFKQAMSTSICWIDMVIALIAELRGVERDQALQDLFKLYITLDPWSENRYKTVIKNRLGMNYSEINRYIKLARETSDDDEIIAGARYAVKDGHLCRWTPGGLEALANFSAEVVEEVVEDDGQDTIRKLVILGSHAQGKPFPPAYVDAKDFSGMNWVIDQWGIAANIYAGTRMREHLRSAIQTLSGESVKQRWVYTHTGWREIDGDLCYLTHRSALGAENVEITLTRSELQMYQLPTDPGDVHEAIHISLSFLDVAPRRITWPLLASMYLAPLSSITEPDFILWLYGTTGSLKSSIAALALNHYGPKFDYNRLPAGWDDTVTTIEKKAFTVKDAPLVIDDFAPQSTISGANELERRASRVLRNIANRTSRGRMKSDLTDRLSHDPRGLTIGTGEQLPSGHSIIGRLFGIEMQRGVVDLDADAYRNRNQLCRSMTAYVLWLKSQMDNLASTIRAWHKEIFDRANEEASSHLRVPSAIASLYVGACMFLNFAQDMGAISTVERDRLVDEAWFTLMLVGHEQSKLIDEEDPGDLFLRILQALLTQKAVYLENKNGEAVAPPSGAKLLGWQDDNRLYLIPETTYNLVASFCRQEGRAFPLKQAALYKKLIEDDIMLSGTSRSTQLVRIDGAVQRVMVVQRPKVLQNER